MIRTLIAKETGHNLRSYRVLILVGIAVVLIAISLTTGALQYTATQEEQQRLIAAERDYLSTIINFREDFINRGVNYYRPVSPLMIVVRGVEGDAPRRATVGYLFYPEFDFSTLNATPLLAIFGTIDLEFIVTVVLSLFALLLSFDAISGEREAGTLKLCLMNALPRASLVLAKVISGCITLVIPVLLTATAGILFVSISFETIAFSGDDWLRIALILGLSGLYLAVFIALGVFVSALFRRSFVSLLVLLMIWISITAVVPRMSTIIVSGMVPVPEQSETRRQYYATFSDLDDELSRAIGDMWDAHHDERQRRTPARPTSNSAAAEERYRQEVDAFRTWAIEASEQINADSARSFSELVLELKRAEEEILMPRRSALERQNQLARSLTGIISPSGALTNLVTRLARTDVAATAEAFSQAVRNENRQINAYTERKIAENPDLAGFTDAGHEVMDLSGEYRAEVKMVRRSALEELLSMTAELLAMSMMFLLLVSAAVLAFSRYDVR